MYTCGAFKKLSICTHMLVHRQLHAHIHTCMARGSWLMARGSWLWLWLWLGLLARLLPWLLFGAPDAISSGRLGSPAVALAVAVAVAVARGSWFVCVVWCKVGYRIVWCGRCCIGSRFCGCRVHIWFRVFV